MYSQTCVYKDHYKEAQKVVSRGRCSLFTGKYVLYVSGEKTGIYSQAVFIYRSLSQV